jgi:hypothetical protein
VIAMNASTEIKDVLREILATGLLRIRSLAWSGDARRCAIEADHIHNLPHLLVQDDSGGLASYWEVERTSYIDQSEPDQLRMWEPLWQRLQPHVEAMASSGTTR